MKHLSRSARFVYLEAVILVLAIVLIVAGAAGGSRISEWSVFAGVALFVLAGVPALRALTGSAPSDDLLLERKPSGRKVSTSLVALSSAAILAVYAAGYERTNSAADQFASQTASARHRTSAVPAVVAAVARSTEQAAIASNALQLSQTPSAKPPVNSVPATAAPIPVPVRETAAPVELPASVPEPARAEIVSSPAVVAALAEEQPVVAAVQVASAPEPPRSRYADGTYFAWGSCRHGTLQVQVVIEAGRITSADINQCRTRYSCSVIRTAPPQVIGRQTPDAIDNVTGATQSIDAYYDAVADALNQAAKSAR